MGEATNHQYLKPTQVGTNISPSSLGRLNDRYSPWGGKNTAQWLRLTYQGNKAYFPWAWADLDGGDDLANIPNC